MIRTAIIPLANATRMGGTVAQEGKCDRG
jgi:hypothetical protein